MLQRFLVLLALLVGAAGCTAPAKPIPAGKAVVHVFFHCGDSEKPVGLPRVVGAADRTLATALQELLKGPTEAERKAGFSSWFSDRTAGMLQAVGVSKEGRAIVDFANFAHVIPNASTSAGSAALKRELGYTVAQFKEVKEIEYRFQGSCDAFGEWQQTGCVVLPAAQYR